LESHLKRVNYILCSDSASFNFYLKDY